MIKDTGARCWVHGVRTRVINDPGSHGASFRYPTGDGNEWGIIYVDLMETWDRVFGYIMHELFEYNCASADLRYSADSATSAGSTGTVFFLTHCQMEEEMNASILAWCGMKKKLQAAWTKQQKKIKP